MRAIGIPNFASGVHTRRSQQAEIARPLPIANPSTSATVGLRTASRRSSTASIRRSYSSPSCAVSKSSNWRMSVPATNALPPAPRRTIVRMSSSASTVSQCATSWSYISNVIALCASGRLNVTQAALPRTS